MGKNGKAIDKKLREEGLTRADLTQEELEMLREEVELEEQGGMVLDGVLSPAMLARIEERKFNREENRE